MISLLRKIFLTITILVISTAATCQKVNKKQPAKVIKQTSKFIHNGVLEYGTYYIPSEIVIKNFIRAKKVDYNYYSYPSKDGKFETYRSDSLITKFKEFIDSFIVRYNKTQATNDNTLNYGDFTNIYGMLVTLEGDRTKIRTQEDLQPIYDSIYFLPDSYEKVRLMLKFGYATIGTKSGFWDEHTLIEIVEGFALGIKNLYQRAFAYSDIADFASFYELDVTAMSLYYLSREDFDNCDMNDNEKSYRQGLICESISNIFIRHYTGQSYAKSYMYIRRAADYFQTISDKPRMNTDNQKSTLIDSWLWSSFRYTDAFNEFQSQHEQRLNDLYTWYSNYFKRLPLSAEVNCLGFAAIASNLTSDSTYNEALLYYLNGFSYATITDNKQYVSTYLTNISSIYASLGKEKFAKEFADLNLYLNEETNDDLQVLYAQISKAHTFTVFKKYDSALIYINKIQFDTSLINKFLPFSYEDLLEATYREKKSIFDVTNIDSANVYDKFLLQFNSNTLEDVSKLVAAESAGISNWLNHSVQKNLANQFELKTSLAANKEIQAQITTAKRDAIELFRQKDSITKTRVTDSIASSKKFKKEQDVAETLKNENDTLQGDIANLQKQKDLLTWATRILGFVALVLIVASIFIRRTNKNLRNENKIIRDENEILSKKKEDLDIAIAQKQKEVEDNDLGKKLAEQKLLNDTALSHDLITQIDHIPAFIQELIVTDVASPKFQNKLNESHKYATDVNSYFQSNFKLRGKLLNKLSDEISAAKRFAQIWEKMQRKIDFVKINDTQVDPQLMDIELPKHNIINFISNSFRYGGIGKNQINIDVKAHQKDNAITIVIEDDGVGFESLNLNKKPANRGINLVVTQVENYNSIRENKYMILFTPENIENIKENDVQKGVRVTYKLIKK